MNLVEVLRRATGYLAGHGSTSPRLDAELLLAHCLELRRLDLYLQHDRDLDEPELIPYRELTRRRGQGEPVAYLTGRREFMGLDFEVTPAVLVPNPDTELLVQLVVAWGRAMPREVRLAEVGVGSGCVAISIAHNLPTASIVGSDIDPQALLVAARNVSRHGLESRIDLLEGDLLANAPLELDAVVANLPYLPDGLDLASEVLAQPAGALRGGPTGGELVERLLRESIGHLYPGGRTFVEADPMVMGRLVEVAESCYQGVRVHRDLGGHQRVLEAWTAPSA
ncbi:MAG TPA: peptide chain release factor N(5)-glutamine methyltransferase [Candidatus Dormibacteraeota bacterium]|jgi:release factor glutamine methyltransferase|nr:peptide chain release factor N(5)-glutamine methyltransferase [Candidatus Dormibacteraeota bacterium]